MWYIYRGMVYSQRLRSLSRSISSLGIILIVLLVLSCSNGIMSGNSADSGIVDVITIDQGAILSAGQRIPMNFFFDPEIADPAEIEVELSKASGETVDSVTLPYSEDMAPFELSDLDDGTYSLNIRVKESDGTVVGDQNVLFFFTAGEYAIQQVTTYPTTIEPDSDILIFADYTYPGGADPFVRWSFEDEIIAYGPLSELGSVLQWHVPDKAGIYTLTAELYPFTPLTGEYDFPAPLKMKGSVFTVNALEPSISEFSPESMYSVLYHFRGNFGNHGFRKDPGVDVIGEPSLEVQNGMFGYRFQGDSGLEWNENLFSATSDNGYDMIIQLKGMFTPVENTVPVISVGDGFLLAQDAGGFSLTVSGETFAFPFEKEYVFIGLRIALENEVGIIEWFDEGEPRLRAQIEPGIIDELIVLKGNTRFGFGINAIIDELGIVSSGVESETINQFDQAMKIKYGKDLILAEGFDSGLEFPDERLTVSGNVFADDATSALVIGENGLLTAADIELPVNGVEIVFEAEEDTFTQLVIDYAGEKSEIALTFRDGYYHGEILPAHSLEPSDDSVYVESETISVSIPGPGIIKSLIIKNIRKELISREYSSPVVISRLASL